MWPLGIRISSIGHSGGPQPKKSNRRCRVFNHFRAAACVPLFRKLSASTSSPLDALTPMPRPLKMALDVETNVAMATPWHTRLSTKAVTWSRTFMTDTSMTRSPPQNGSFYEYTKGMRQPYRFATHAVVLCGQRPS